MKSTSKNRILNQGADHARTYKISFRQRTQVKCVLSNLRKEHGFALYKSSYKRFYSCKVNTDFTKIDGNLVDLNSMKVARQDARSKLKDIDLRGLELLKKEVDRKSDQITPLIIESIKLSRWPMLDYSKEIKDLVYSRQNYLALLSSLYEYRSILVEKQVVE